VLVIGAGVAGLQAIATAKRLGARIEAFDTRPAVKEQVESLGAKFIDIDLGETGEQGGYAKELTPEQQAKQREGMVKALERADIVITTAALFGRPAPGRHHGRHAERMKPGSLVVDYAVSTGGNVEGSVAGDEVDRPRRPRRRAPELPGAGRRRREPDVREQHRGPRPDHLRQGRGGVQARPRGRHRRRAALITHDGEIVNERSASSTSLGLTGRRQPGAPRRGGRSRSTPEGTHACS
jgi:hypothetical protein